MQAIDLTERFTQNERTALEIIYKNAYNPKSFNPIQKLNDCQPVNNIYTITTALISAIQCRTTAPLAGN